MLADLQRLFATFPASTPADEYRHAVIDENALSKATSGTRSESYRRLRELYALDPAVPLFHALRGLWDADPASQPLLALLMALARDPTLRATADAVLTAAPGEPVSGERLTAAVRAEWPGRYGARSGVNIGLNAATSWTYSGHLRGRARKTRAPVAATPVAMTFALLLGHLCGQRGEALLSTFWTRALDASPAEIRALAFEASRQGWMEYRHAGGVTEVGFHHLLGEERRR